MHDEPGDAEGGTSLWTAWMPALTAFILFLPEGDGKNDVAQQILSACVTYCSYEGISGCGVNPQKSVYYLHISCNVCHVKYI